MGGEFRALPVPEGLEGMRVDAAIAKLFGVSRSVASEMAAEDDVLVDGAAAQKSDRVTAGAMLEVTLPEPKRAPQPVTELVEGLEILYQDADVIAVDKPVGVAAHPTLGWEGPDVVGGLQAMGFTLPDAGPPERQGIVQRLDVGTSGVMVVAVSERAYSVLKRAFKQRTVDKGYHALVQGHLDPPTGTIDAPIGRHPGSDWRFAVTAMTCTHDSCASMIAGCRFATAVPLVTTTGTGRSESRERPRARKPALRSSIRTCSRTRSSSAAAASANATPALREPGHSTTSRTPWRRSSSTTMRDWAVEGFAEVIAPKPNRVGRAPDIDTHFGRAIWDYEISFDVDGYRA